MTSLILRTAMQLVVPLTLLFGAYVTLKGHNAPGGGFIGGLILSVGLVLYRLSYGRLSFERMIPFHPRVLIFAGLAIATLTGFVPMLFGWPFLTSYVDYIPMPFGGQAHFASALFFDVGVLLTVIGASVGMICRVSEEVELADFEVLGYEPPAEAPPLGQDEDVTSSTEYSSSKEAA